MQECKCQLCIELVYRERLEHLHRPLMIRDGQWTSVPSPANNVLPPLDLGPRWGSGFALGWVPPHSRSLPLYWSGHKHDGTRQHLGMRVQCCLCSSASCASHTLPGFAGQPGLTASHHLTHATGRVREEVGGANVIGTALSKHCCQ